MVRTFLLQSLLAFSFMCLSEQSALLLPVHHTPRSSYGATVPLIYELEASADNTHTLEQQHSNGADPLGEHSPEPHSVPPIHRIPTELLGEIFMHHLRARSLYVPYRRSRLTSMSSISSPVTISHVCARWRGVSLSMATLWSSIQVRRPDVYMIPIIRLWLQRAGDCPLSVCIMQSDDVGHLEHAATENVLSLLTERVHLWKSIDFQFSVGPYRSLLDLSEGAAEMLESAQLDLRYWDHASADKLWRVLHASPALRHADWFGFDESELPSHAPWSQLTHITISRLITEGEVMELVKTCSAVIILDLPFLDRSPTPVESTCVTLPSLHTLKFATSASEYDTMFKQLILPGLAYLDVKHACGHSPAGTLPFIDGLLERSSCRLERFALCDWKMNEDQLLSILGLPAFQSLSELELMTSITDKTVLSLTCDQDGSKSCLLPHLKALTIGESHTSDGVLSDMVVLRLPALKVFQVEDAFVETELSPELGCSRDSLVIDNLRREGYQFHLSYDMFSI